MLFVLIILLALVVSVLSIVRYIYRRRCVKNSIAFFHLYCSSGGGGERVLWHTVKALLNRYPKYSIYIYSHSAIKAEDKLRVLTKVKNIFKIDLIDESDVVDRINFVPLLGSFLVESKRYPYFTLLGQIIGSMLLAIEAATRITPDVYIETIGFTFTLPIFQFLNCKTITYIHYPTISSDMIEAVRTSTHAAFNNRKIFVKYEVMRKLKLYYYKILAYLYGFAGRRADLVMVNSTWTQNHINSIFGSNAHVVYPPCDTENFQAINSKRDPQQTSPALNIISVAQFRPEKNHQLQIEAFDSFLSETGAYDSKLVLYGGCRDEEDKKRVEHLREFIVRLDLCSNVEIILGASFERLMEGMLHAQVAIHTMENEHFGIVLVECMAAGLIMVAHNSGGPKTDIIEDNKSGFLANDVSDFAEKLAIISKMKPENRQMIIDNGIARSERFSSKSFEKKFIQLVDGCLT